MSEPHSDLTILACPHCGGTSFSWTIRQVQFGIDHAFDAGQYSEEGRKLGPITGSDVDDHGVFCTICEDSYDRNDLVPSGSTTVCGGVQPHTRSPERHIP